MSQEESGYLHELKETKLQATVDRMLYQLASEGLDLVTNFVITDGSKKAGFVDLLDNQPKVFFRNSDEKPG